MSNSVRRVKTADTIFDILEEIAASDGGSLAELADRLDYAKSTIHTHLSTLEDRGFVVFEDGEYRLGLEFFRLGTAARERYTVNSIGRPIIEELAEETGEVVWIVVEENGWGFFLDNATGKRAVQTHAAVGERTNLHTLASGKLILAHLPDHRVDEIVRERGLPERTDATISDREALDEELAEIREQGYSFNDEEAESGVRGFAAPVFEDGRIVAAVCVSGPANRLTKDRCHPDQTGAPRSHQRNRTPTAVPGPLVPTAGPNDVRLPLRPPPDHAETGGYSEIRMPGAERLDRPLA